MSDLAAAAALALNGVTAGLLLGSLHAPVPRLLGMAAGPYLKAKQFLVPRYDPAMPIAIVANVVLDCVAAALAPHASAQVVFALAACLLLAVIAVSLVRNVPINNWEMTLDPGIAPSDWARIDPRKLWHVWHVVRTGALTLALAATFAAILLG
ncbi:MAG TPA: DUF1772 domain-containing protein [Streptosporangiaceae bacterium]|nr:DUF1772 domain-containing protein [Streptosporangiaceae bacterium]